jgi:hypothetical protein
VLLVFDAEAQRAEAGGGHGRVRPGRPAEPQLAVNVRLPVLHV